MREILEEYGGTVIVIATAAVFIGGLMVIAKMVLGGAGV